MNVLIVSDVRLHREGLACLLEPVPTITVVGVVDVGGALNILHRLRQLHRRVRVVAIGVREVESEVLACAAAGIDGYVPVNAAADDLVAVLDGLKRDELVCSPKVAASLYNCVGLLRAVSAEPLTVRELEVVDLIRHRDSHCEESCPEHLAKAERAPSRSSRC
jgi:two-component system, NarL family, nitrate/nitrite response regulator NarL